MRANRAQLTIAVVVLAFTIFDCFRSYPHLPDPMASNFGGDGAPGGWSSKRSFMIVCGASMAFWFGALLATPLIAVNARQKFDDATRVWLRDTVGWFLVASLAFSAAVTHMVIEANLVSGHLSGLFIWLLAIYMSYMGWWTLRLVRRVRRFKNMKSPTS